MAAAEPGAHSRLERLVAKARAILLFERMWRIVVPPLLVLGLFICLSWTGLWLEAPHWARGLGVFAFAAGVLAAVLPLRKFRFPSRKEALERIDRVSGLRQRPAAVLEDRLGNATGDPATRAFWSLHRRRAEQSIALLRTGPPSPRIADLDRYALRAAIVVGLVATAFVAGPERYARVVAAFDWRFAGFSGHDQRLDAWIDPPAYTGRAPIVLNLRSTASAAPQKIEAPSGSLVIIRSSAGKPVFEAKGGLAEAAKDQPGGPAPLNKPSQSKTDTETRLVLRGDASLTLGSFGARLGAFDLIAIADQPPTIALTDAPKVNARGTLTLEYKIADDYGAISAEAGFANPVLPSGAPVKRSLVDPPQAALALPSTSGLVGEAETTIDLSEHPWAGARVQMTLVARDEGGNAGESAPIALTLPQKPFTKPLARALAEQRRNLVLAPDDKAKVATALEALMIAPEAFDASAGVYLGLRAASERLAAAAKDSDLVAVANFLWEMALRIENGDLSETERELRAAEQQLRDALRRNASPEEIRKLSENLRAIMDKFLREFAEQQQNQMDQTDPDAARGHGRTVDPKDLQAMLDKMQDMAHSGDVADAEKMLDHLRSVLDNLKMARPHKKDPRAQEMSRAIDELGQMSQQQQDLRDETYQSGETGKRRQKRQRGQIGPPGRPGFGDPLAQDDDEDQDLEGDDKGKTGSAGQASQAQLQKRQEALRDRLAKLQKRLKQSGQGEPGLDDAQQAMRDALKALGRGAPGGDQAVDAQGRAVDALHEGAQKLADSMGGQGEGEGSGQPGEDAGDGEDGESANGQFGQDGSDPLGRPMGRERAFNPGARFDPMGVPAAQRAQRVLEELRRRVGEPARPREEMDYLERLLRRY